MEIGSSCVKEISSAIGYKTLFPYWLLIFGYHVLFLQLWRCQILFFLETSC